MMSKILRKLACAALAATTAVSLLGCSGDSNTDGGNNVNVGATVNYDAEYQGNPYLPLWEYIPDAEPYVFEDPDNPGKYRLYVYGSHDTLKTAYCGTDLVVWSAPVEDLSDWRCDGVIFESVVNGTADVLYAPDVALVEENGKRPTTFIPTISRGAGQQWCASPTVRTARLKS